MASGSQGDDTGDKPSRPIKMENVKAKAMAKMRAQSMPAPPRRGERVRYAPERLGFEKVQKKMDVED